MTTRRHAFINGQWTDTSGQHNTMPGITYNTTKTHRSDVAAEHGVDVEVESRRAVVVAVAVVDDVKVGGEGRVAVHQTLVQEVLQLPHGLQEEKYRAITNLTN